MVVVRKEEEGAVVARKEEVLRSYKKVLCGYVYVEAV